VERLIAPAKTKSLARMSAHHWKTQIGGFRFLCLAGQGIDPAGIEPAGIEPVGIEPIGIEIDG